MRSAKCRYGVIFPVEAGAKQLQKKKNPQKKEQKHTLKKIVVLMHEFFTSRPTRDVYFKLNTAQTHTFLLFIKGKKIQIW